MAVIFPVSYKVDTTALRNAEGQMSGFTRAAKGMLSPLAALGVGFSVGAIANFTKDLIGAAEAELQGNARLQNITESMGLFGNKAGEVTKRLQELATKQQLANGIDDDAIKAIQAKLMTFRELGKTADTAGGSFDRATQAALDLAAAGFGTAETNAVQLGKALQDPIKGLASLGRAGVTFTAAEKERIKTLVESNRLGEAQALVLKAIETQVGGTAAATATSSDKMKQGWENLKETIGMALLPAFNDIAKTITDEVLPAATKFFEDFKKGKTPLNAVTDTIKDLLNFVKDNWSWIQVLGTAVASTAAAFKGFQMATDLAHAALLAWNIAAGIATSIHAGYTVGLIANTAATEGNTLVRGLNTAGVWLGNAAWMVMSGQLWANVTAWVADTAAAVANTIALQAAYVKQLLLTGATRVATLAQWAFNAALAANPIGLVVVAIAALTAGLIWFFTQTKVGKDIWANLVNFMKDTGKNLGDFFKTVWDGISSSFTAVFNSISAAFKGYVNVWIGLLNFIIGALDTIQIKIPTWVPGVGGQTWGVNIPKIPALAEGGIVPATPGGRLVRVGEGGSAEAIIPLNKARMGGNTHNISVTVNAGMGANGTQIGKQIVDEIKKYERANGSVWVTA